MNALFDLVDSISLDEWLHSGVEDAEDWMESLWVQVTTRGETIVAGARAAVVAEALVFRRLGPNTVRGMHDTESKFVADWESCEGIPTMYDRYRFFSWLLFLLGENDFDEEVRSRVARANDHVERHWRPPPDRGVTYAFDDSR